MDGLQLHLRQAAAENLRQLRPGGGPKNRDTLQSLRQNAVFPGPVDVVCIPGRAQLCRGVWDSPVLFIDPNSYSQPLGEGHGAIGGECIVSCPGHQSQSVLHPDIGIVPGMDRYVGKGGCGQLLRQAKGVHTRPFLSQDLKRRQSQDQQQAQQPDGPCVFSRHIKSSPSLRVLRKRATSLDDFKIKWGCIQLASKKEKISGTSRQALHSYGERRNDHGPI